MRSDGDAVRSACERVDRVLSGSSVPGHGRAAELTASARSRSVRTAPPRAPRPPTRRRCDERQSRRATGRLGGRRATRRSPAEHGPGRGSATRPAASRPSRCPRGLSGPTASGRPGDGDRAQPAGRQPAAAGWLDVGTRPVHHRPGEQVAGRVRASPPLRGRCGSPAERRPATPRPLSAAHDVRGLDADRTPSPIGIRRPSRCESVLGRPASSPRRRRCRPPREWSTGDSPGRATVASGVAGPSARSSSSTGTSASCSRTSASFGLPVAHRAHRAPASPGRADSCCSSASASGTSAAGRRGVPGRRTRRVDQRLLLRAVGVGHVARGTGLGHVVLLVGRLRSPSILPSGAVAADRVTGRRAGDRSASACTIAGDGGGRGLPVRAAADPAGHVPVRSGDHAEPAGRHRRLGARPAAAARRRHPQGHPAPSGPAVLPAAARSSRRSCRARAPWWRDTARGRDVGDRVRRSSSRCSGRCGCSRSSPSTTVAPAPRNSPAPRGLPLATTYHLLRTCAHEGWLQRLDDGSYVLGHRHRRRPRARDGGPRASRTPGRRSSGCATSSAARSTWPATSTARSWWPRSSTAPGRRGSTCGWACTTPRTRPRWASASSASCPLPTATTTSPAIRCTTSPRARWSTAAGCGCPAARRGRGRRRRVRGRRLLPRRRRRHRRTAWAPSPSSARASDAGARRAVLTAAGRVSRALALGPGAA